MENPRKYDPIRSWASAFQCPTGIGSVWRLRPPRHSLQKKAFERLSRTSSATMAKRMITTKAIAAPSRCFLSVWIRIGSTPLCGSCKTNRPGCRRSNRVPAMHEAQQYLGPLPRRTSFRTRTGLFLSQGSSPIRKPSISQPMQESSAFVYASVLGACFSGR